MALWSVNTLFNPQHVASINKWSHTKIDDANKPKQSWFSYQKTSLSKLRHQALAIVLVFAIRRSIKASSSKKYESFLSPDYCSWPAFLLLRRLPRCRGSLLSSRQPHWKKNLRPQIYIKPCTNWYETFGHIHTRHHFSVYFSTELLQHILYPLAHTLRPA